MKLKLKLKLVIGLEVRARDRGASMLVSSMKTQCDVYTCCIDLKMILEHENCSQNSFRSFLRRKSDARLVVDGSAAGV